MDLYNRLALANVINNMTGSRIDVNGRIGKYDRNVIQKIKSGLKPITAGTGLGVAVATAVNAVDPSIVAAPVNAAALGTLALNLSKSPVMGWISGILGGFATGVAQYIPGIGGAVDNALATENIAVLGTLGAIVGLAGLAGSKIFKSINAITNRFKYSKEQKLISKIDCRKYKDDNILEYNKIKELLESKEQSLEELTIIALANTYMKEKGMNLDDNISTIQELKTVISKSDSREKAKILRLINSLDEYNNRDLNGFRRVIKNIANTLYWTTTIGLAGLSIWDIVKGGTALEDLSSKIFNTEDKFRKLTPVLDSNNETMPYSNDFSSEVSPPTASPTPLPTPEIRPEPAPAPTINPIPKPVDTSTTYDLKFEDLLGNIDEYAKTISTMPLEDAYKNIWNIGNPGLIQHLVDKLPKDSISNIVEYINSSSTLDKSNINFGILKTALNNRIQEINNHIDFVIRTTRDSANVASGASAIVNTKNAMIEDDEKMMTY